jgi:hypothetical protein
MKKFYFLLIGLLIYCNAHSQTIVFSSAPFKATVLAASVNNTIAYDINSNPMRIDVNNDGEVSYAEAANVYSLRLADINPVIYNINGIEHFVNLTWIDISASRITQTNLAALMPHLQYLYCNRMGTLVSNLNISGLDLKILEGASNSAMIPYFNGTGPNGSVSQFTNLETLACDGNTLTNLDIAGLSHLKSLTCSSNSLTNLDLTGYSNLQKLFCGNNLLTNLNLTGCNSLTELRASTNKLTGLIVADKPNLLSINVSPNPLLTNLTVSNLPALQYLDAQSCALNSLTLSGLPALISLSCEHNQLTGLNLNGFANLESISCSDNHLTALDLNSCPKLLSIYCYNNNLTSLFMKNGLTNYSSAVMLSNNPALQYICCDDNEIDGIQTLVGANCNVNSYCSFVPGGNYNVIQGTNKFDNNDNGCDISDLSFKNLKLKLTSTNGALGYLISNNNGSYSVPLQSGSFTITPQIENADFFIITPPSRTVAFPATPSPATQDFCFRRNGDLSDIGIYLLPMQNARPGFNAYYKIVYKNKGNKAQSGAVNLTFNDALLDVVSTNPAIASQAQNLLSWNYTNLLPFETREIELVLKVNSPTDTPPVLSGTLLSFTAAITDDGTDVNPDDNSDSYDEHAVNSFDPNDKTCLEGATITPEMVGKEVNYMIRFENSGTANAENIVVKDIIDTTKFDINSLIQISGSHPFATKISNPNKIEFIFENINLPFDDAHNDGYVAFKIKTKTSLALGDTFSNTASIYFDYNFPIITNTATTTIAALAVEDFEFDSYFKIYPNPSNTVLNIDAKRQIEVSSISIYNTLGQLVLVIPNAQKMAAIDVSALKTGNYFIKIISDKGTSNAKFIKN